MARIILFAFYIYVYFDRRPNSYGVPRYVGKGSTGDRAFAHLELKNGDGNPYLFEIIQGHRTLGIIPRIKIIRCDSEKESLAREVMLIARYGRIDKGTGTLANRTDGGEGCNGLCLGPDNIKRYTLAAHARWKDPILREKYLVGFDRVHSDPEWRAARSITMRDLNHNPVFQAKRQPAFQKAMLSEERAARISEFANRRPRDSKGHFVNCKQEKKEKGQDASLICPDVSLFTEQSVSKPGENGERREPLTPWQAAKAEAVETISKESRVKRPEAPGSIKWWWF